jgi:nitrogen fixation protein NifU and related proteins
MPLDATALYREILVDHGKNPRNLGSLADATHEHTAKNPLCGDRITLRIRLEGDRVRSARFEARGCMIARASASMMTEAILGRTCDEALALVDTIDALVNAEPAPPHGGDLEPLRAVRGFPARKGCVTLPWQALKSALAFPSPPDGKEGQ